MKRVVLFIALFAHVCLRAETSFIALNAETNEIIAASGPDIDVRYSPCSTFKIALSLAGYDLEILKNAHEPIWPYDGSKVLFESHKTSQTPKTWMSFSVIWYSKVLAQQIGRSRLQSLLSQFAYGNQDLSGDGTEEGYKAAHLSSSLQISPKEQVMFLKRMVNADLPISGHANQMTREILFAQETSDGKLFGKAGSGFDSRGGLLGWYVGWFESEKGKHVFALLMKDLDSFPSKEERQKIVIDFLHSRLSGTNEEPRCGRFLIFNFGASAHIMAIGSKESASGRKFS